MKYILLSMFITCSLWAQEHAHAEAAMTLHLNAAPSTVFPLFGPVREAEWAHGWNPAMLYPSDRVQVAGSVFTTGKLIWILTEYDESALRLSYAVVDPGVAAEQLEIVLKLSGSATEATVTHRWTALSESVNSRVANWAREFPAQREHWEHAINQRLQELAK
jgi:hypothetical protein